VSLSRLQARHWGLVVGATLLAMFWGLPRAAGTLVGGALIGLSLLVYVAGAKIILARLQPRLAIGLLFVKLLAFLGFGWLILVSDLYRPDPLGFVVGVTCFPLATVWEAIGARD
jgi:hypothetical protein